MLTARVTKTIVVTLSLLAAGLLQNCKSSTQRVRVAPYPIRSEASEIDNCSLITKADVEAALNESCKGPYRLADFKSTEESDPVTFCSYISSPDDTSPIKFVDIEVHGVPANKNNSMELLERFKKEPSTEFQILPGLGDGAFWRNTGTDTFPVVELYTFKKDRVYFRISILGVLNQAMALDKAKTLALQGLTKV